MAHRTRTRSPARRRRSSAPGTALVPQSPPPSARPEYGWIEVAAHTDGGIFDSCVEIRYGLPREAVRAEDVEDPEVTIEIRLPGETGFAETQRLENVRASDLDNLVAKLREAIALGRYHKVLPPALSEAARWRRLHAERAEDQDAERRARTTEGT